MVLGAKHASALDIFCKEKFQRAFKFASWRSVDILAQVGSSFLRARRFRRHHHTPLSLSCSLHHHYLPLLHFLPLHYFGLQKRNIVMRKKIMQENFQKI